MDYPLTLTQFFERTRRLFHRKRMATRVPGVGLSWYTYADYADRVCRLAGALHGLGALEIILLTEDEHDDIGILLDRARFTEVGELRPLVLAIFDGA